MTPPAAEAPVIPSHIAVIMDGNGRWARQRGLSRMMGHQKGSETVRMIKQACLDLKVPYLTLYAFSHENWKRPKEEIDFLMNLLNRSLDQEGPALIRDEVRFATIGDLTALSPSLQEKIAALKIKTRDHSRMTLCLALNYGSRQEITRAVRRFFASVLKDAADPAEIARRAGSLDEKALEAHLDTAGMPDPDLLIRTSGEMRLSNFLLWQCSYSEICISQKAWPDYSREDFMAAIGEYAKRERRFGAVL